MSGTSSLSAGIGQMINDKRTQTANRREALRRQAQAAPGAAQREFRTGTMNLLNEARGVIENAVGQGQELNPMIYQMLGLQPTYQDNTADLESARGAFGTAQSQLDEAQKTLSQLQAIPGGRRSPQQKKQLRQLKKQMPALQRSMETARDAQGKLETMPKTITGFQRLDENAIPATSPFSAQNPLHQAQATEAERLNQYLAGGEVDPTLKHQYSVAEDQLRASLAQRFGPDFESSSVGQMALSNFNRQKNEAFATWNQQQVEKYNNLAFQGQANLNALLGQNIALTREPSNAALGYGGALSDAAGQRLTEEQVQNAFNLNRAGLAYSPVQASPGLGATLGAGTSAAGQIAKWALTPNQPATQQPSSLTYGWNTGYGGGSDMAGAGVTAAGGGVDYAGNLGAGLGTDAAGSSGGEGLGMLIGS